MYPSTEPEKVRKYLRINVPPQRNARAERGGSSGPVIEAVRERAETGPG